MDYVQILWDRFGSISLFALHFGICLGCPFIRSWDSFPVLSSFIYVGFCQRCFFSLLLFIMEGLLSLFRLEVVVKISFEVRRQYNHGILWAKYILPDKAARQRIWCSGSLNQFSTHRRHPPTPFLSKWIYYSLISPFFAYYATFHHLLCDWQLPLASARPKVIIWVRYLLQAANHS